jgi:putative NIF3 family GTP cyclohydrolase 1 type 2
LFFFLPPHSPPPPPHAGADLLLVHHGMFWGGLQPIVASRYDGLRHAIAAGLAVYASHLPLDLHPQLGNNVRLAHTLDLKPDGGFGEYRGFEIGVSGAADLATTDIIARVRAFAQPLGSPVIYTPHLPDRRTRRWAIVTGAGASTETLREAVARGVDTLIVGEGPHHTAVEAQELGLVVIYGGHYATETLGVQAAAAALQATFALPWSFIHLPTGL